MKNLAYKIPNVITKAIAKVTSKEKTEVKTSGNEKLNVEVDEDCFKIAQGTTHQNQKRLEADERRKLVDTILKRDLDPSDYLVNVVNVSL